MEIRDLIASITCCFCVFFLTACTGPRPLAITGHTYTQPIEHRANTNIVAIDCDLTGSPHGAVQVARQYYTWSQDGRLRIVLELENRTTKNLRLQIQTAFKDEGDNFLPDQTPYQTTVLQRNQTHRYECTALSREAAKAHVLVRWAVSE